jgi:hypothetical protein
MNREFDTKKELFDFLAREKKTLILEKKEKTKQADAFSFASGCLIKNDAQKSASDAADLLSKESITVEAVINTTGLMDSHKDVHIPGLWKKTLKENKNPYHLREHQMNFEGVISDRVKAGTKNFTWKELGFDGDGETEALVFESEVEKSRNPFMFEQYARGYVKNHSVGMQYVKLHLCINSGLEEHREEKKNWDKYIEYVVNREKAEENGYFWAVTEAKLIEGSAVLFGSNPVTPTCSVKNIEPPSGTQTTAEPPSGTRKESLFEKLSKLKN